MKLFNSLALVLASVALIGCGGGGSSSTTVTIETHSSAALSFLNALKYDLDYPVSLVKSNTRQDYDGIDYIVVYDADFNSYDAYDISEYIPGEDINAYLDDFEDFFYYNLDYLGASFGENLFRTYDDFGYEVIFSKGTTTPADEVKKSEVVNHVKMKKATEQLTVEFGLSPARAEKVAGLALQLHTADKSKMTTYQYDQYSKAILGSSFSDIKSAVEAKLSGDDSALNPLFVKAAKTNGVTVEKVEKLTNLFLQN